CVKSMEIRWKAFGRCCAAGVVRIGAFPKRNSRSTSGSSSLYTTSASEARRCCLHSLSDWSRKTPESNKSVDSLCTSIPIKSVLDCDMVDLRECWVDGSTSGGADLT